GGERLGIYFVEPGADLRAMRVVYDRAGSALARIEPRSIDWPRVLAGADWFHASGITPALGDGPAAALAGAIACARAQGIQVSFDLNYREALWRDRDPRPLVEPLARQATVLIANPTAVRAMLGIEADDTSLATPEPARELAKRLAERCGVKRVALTRREILGPRRHGWSAVLYDAETGSFAQSRRHCVDVVDRVGGGDSFVWPSSRASRCTRTSSWDAPGAIGSSTTTAPASRVWASSAYPCCATTLCRSSTGHAPTSPCGCPTGPRRSRTTTGPSPPSICRAEPQRSGGGPWCVVWEAASTSRTAAMSGSRVSAGFTRPLIPRPAAAWICSRSCPLSETSDSRVRCAPTTAA